MSTWRPSRPRWSLRGSAPRWLLGLLPVVVVLFGASLVASVVTAKPRIAVDAALYQHVGWLVTRGGVPYVDIWDINPPLTFALTTVFAFLADGDMVLLHRLSVAATLLATVTSVLLVGLLAVWVTGEDVAGLVAGLVVLTVPEVYGLPPYGVRSQYFALLFGVAALAFVYRERPLLAGASAAVGAGFWQPGIGVVPLVLGMTAHRNGRRGFGRAVLGGVAVAALTVLPFVVAGAAVPMVVETVIAPFYGRSPYTLLGRTYAVLHALGYATVLLPVGAYGWLLALKSPDRWWVTAGGVVYTLFALFLNMNGSLDLLPLLAFLALGVALVAESVAAKASHRLGLVALVSVVVLSGPVWHLAAAPPLREPLEARWDDAEANKITSIRDDDLSTPGMRTVYWHQLRPDTCHYRLSWTERRWIVRTDARLGDTTCGRWPG